MWDKLRIDEDEREKFLAEHKNLCVETIRTVSNNFLRKVHCRVEFLARNYY